MRQKRRLARSFQPIHERRTRFRATTDDQHIRTRPHQRPADHATHTLRAASHDGHFPRNGEEFVQNAHADFATLRVWRSEEHTSELQSLMRISYAVFCLKKHTTKEHT